MALLGMLASEARAKVNSIAADPHPGGRPCTGDVLTKTIGYFTSTAQPSVIVGRGEFKCTSQGGLFLSRSVGDINGPWVTTTINPGGNHYERSRAYTYKGERYPGLIVSEGSRTKWYRNPLNDGEPVTHPWSSGVVASRPCHDMKIADIDGDGRLDVVGSATGIEHTGSFISYNNGGNNWVERDDVTPAGDGVAVVLVDGIWDIATAHDGKTWLYINPLSFGKNPRTTKWPGYGIGPGTEGNSLEGGMLDGVPTIFVASNEEPWPSGLGMLRPHIPTYTMPWKFTTIDSSYRDVHEINAAVWPQGDSAYDASGDPVLPAWLDGAVVGEEEQASSGCNSQHLNDHPATSGCRVAYYNLTGEGAFTRTLISDLGTQNQSVIRYGGQLAIAGANHNVYGAADPALHIWVFDPGRTPSLDETAK